MASTHYDALGVAADCTIEEIRRAYHNAARQYHPDKRVGAAASDQEKSVLEERFHRVQVAYETLGDADRRAKYDDRLVQEQLRRKREEEHLAIAEEILLTDMKQLYERDDDGEAGYVVYTHGCRCGDLYEVTEGELLNGIDVIPCTGCSLHIRVLMTHPSDY